MRTDVRSRSREFTDGTLRSVDRRLTSGQFMGVVAALLLGAGLASAQTNEQRLSEVAKDLFSPAASVDADITQLKAVLAADPKSAQAHMLLGLAYRTKGSTDLMGEAVGELRQAIDLDPSLVPARVYLAHLYLDLGRPERAQDELQAALTQLPGQPQLQALLAECQRQLGKPDAALELTQQALKADPSMAEARYYEGQALYDLKRRDEAIQAFEQAIKDGGRRPEVYGSLGKALLDAGRVDEAIVSLTEAVKLDPSRPEPMLPLARAYRLKGQLARADAALKTVRSLVGTSGLSVADQQVQRDLSFEEAGARGAGAAQGDRPGPDLRTRLSLPRRGLPAAASLQPRAGSGGARREAWLAAAGGSPEGPPRPDAGRAA
jgi:Tfp pilus assembly protein PilF